MDTVTHVDLSRFLDAQEDGYETALAELMEGQKRSHWIWFIFPQIDGLAMSDTAQFYSIKSPSEARAYLAHPLLGRRLKTCLQVLLQHQDLPIEKIMGYPDNLKLRSCVTLFREVEPQNHIWDDVLAAFYESEPDNRTLKLLSLRGLGEC